jgi:hypothetical protein
MNIIPFDATLMLFIYLLQPVITIWRTRERIPGSEMMNADVSSRNKQLLLRFLYNVYRKHHSGRIKLSLDLRFMVITEPMG